ncbi:MAG: hypothetical protein ACRDID_09470 [Ktedonobacterales bacterium]
MNTPYPPDASTIRQSSGPVSAAGPTPPPPPTGAPRRAPTTTPTATRPSAKAPRLPGVRRRLALLAAALYMPVILLGYALYLHGPTDCVVGALCSLDTWPALAQVLLLALGFIALYLVGVRPLAALLDDRQPARSELARTLRQASRFETIRPLLAIFGALIALLLIAGMVARSLTFPAFVIGGGVMALLFILAALGEPQRP